VVRRIAAVAAVVLALLATVGVGTAGADPIRNPNADFFFVTCGGEEFLVSATGAAGHILGSTSNAILFGGTVTVFVAGEQVDQFSFSTAGTRPTLTGCSAFSEFVDEAGNLVRIEITDAEILLTPPSG
jgi:hypothetical protein